MVTMGSAGRTARRAGRANAVDDARENAQTGEPTPRGRQKAISRGPGSNKRPAQSPGLSQSDGALDQLLRGAGPWRENATGLARQLMQTHAGNGSMSVRCTTCSHACRERGDSWICDQAVAQVDDIGIAFATAITRLAASR